MAKEIWRVHVICGARDYGGSGSTTTLHYDDEAAAQNAFNALVAARAASKDHSNGDDRAILIADMLGQASLMSRTLHTIHLSSLSRSEAMVLDANRETIALGLTKGYELTERGQLRVSKSAVAGEPAGQGTESEASPHPIEPPHAP